MAADWRSRTNDITYLLDMIIQEYAPRILEGTLQMTISSLEYSTYVGRVAIGAVLRGSLQNGQQVPC